MVCGGSGGALVQGGDSPWVLILIFFSCAQLWACSWLSGFRAVLAHPISLGLCHSQMSQVRLKRMVLRKAGFSLVPPRVLAATPFSQGMAAWNTTGSLGTMNA